MKYEDLLTATLPMFSVFSLDNVAVAAAKSPSGPILSLRLKNFGIGRADAGGAAARNAGLA